MVVYFIAHKSILQWGKTQKILIVLLDQMIRMY
jgi:hypothetical protein